MKPFDLRFDIVILRFYLMMAVIIAAIFARVPYLAVLGLPIFLSALMGVKFFPQKKKESAIKVNLVPKTLNTRKTA